MLSAHIKAGVVMLLCNHSAGDMEIGGPASLAELAVPDSMRDPVFRKTKQNSELC